MSIDTSIFPLIKRFKDVKSSSAILLSEIIIHDKCFRSGTIFNIVGWRDVEGKPFLIISKGSWEGLIEYEYFLSISEKLS